MYLQVVDLSVPELLELGKLLFNNAVLLVFRYYLAGGLFVLLSEKICYPLALSRLQSDVALQCAAGVSAVIQRAV